MIKSSNSLLKPLVIALVSAVVFPAYALTPADDPITHPLPKVDNAVEQRALDESAIDNNPYAVSLYQPTYLIPFYHTISPDYSIYDGSTPNDQNLGRNEIKYQFSFKIPVWKITSKDKLYLAYTQLSYWQAYAGSAYFRETNYEPEIYVSHTLNRQLVDGWTTNFINVGAMHQSNGKGGYLERSWNRAYAAAISSKGNMMIEIKPWLVAHDSTYERDNPDMTRYLGNGQIIAAYKMNKQVFSFTLENEAESEFKRGSEMLTWSFPLGGPLEGYVQLFSGYGQSLIEYNHYTNGIGIGVSLSDWL